MVEQKQSAIQRIQVGVIGLVVVLLFVTLANMVLDRVTNNPQAAGISGSVPIAVEKDATPDEPLAELGVTPVAKDETAEQAADRRAPAARPAAPPVAPSTRP